MFCHSFAVGVLGAAQRLLPITHSEAQQILHGRCTSPWSGWRRSWKRGTGAG